MTSEQGTNLTAAQIEPEAGSVVAFDPSQRGLFADKARVCIVNWHRQKGKDFTAAAKAVASAMEGQEWFIVSKTQRQADATFAKAKKFFRSYQHVLRKLGEIRYADQQFADYDKSIDEAFICKAREMIFPGGGRVVSLPGRDPDVLAGLTGNVIFTEFGLFANGGFDHWSVIFPITTRGYQMVVISTPRGKNTKFYELWRDTENYSVHTCDIHQSVEKEGFELRDNNGNPCSIEQLRRMYKDEGKWQREYLCQFTGDLEALIKWAQLEEAGALGVDQPFSFKRMDDGAGYDPNFFKGKIPAGWRAEFGWDVARVGHLSSLWMNLYQPGKPRKLAAMVLMHNCPFALQRQVIIDGMNAGGYAAVGCGDSTGLGMDSNETLTQKYRDRWEGINFGGSRKKEIASAMATAIGDRSQVIPPVDGPYKFIATDLYAMQKDESGGTLALDETENTLLPESHCDLFFSGGLALMAGSRNYRPPLNPPSYARPIGM
jgi:phage FluMu gp28-like protein